MKGGNHCFLYIQIQKYFHFCKVTAVINVLERIIPDIASLNKIKYDINKNMLLRELLNHLNEVNALKDLINTIDHIMLLRMERLG